MQQLKSPPRNKRSLKAVIYLNSGESYSDEKDQVLSDGIVEQRKDQTPGDDADLIKERQIKGTQEDRDEKDSKADSFEVVKGIRLQKLRPVRNRKKLVVDSNEEDSEKSSHSCEEDTGSLDLRKIRLGVAKRKNLICQHCETPFVTHLSLISHLRKKHLKYSYKCVICRDSLNSRSIFIYHMKKWHPEIDPYPCDYPRCNKSFLSAKKLRDHQKAHRPYMCRFCMKRFASQHHMHRHVDEVHM